MHDMEFGREPRIVASGRPRLNHLFPPGADERTGDRGVLLAVRNQRAGPTATGSLPPADPDGGVFELLKSVETLSEPGRIGVWRARATARTGPPVPGRVCALRKTDEAIEVALKSLRRQASKKGRKLKPETLRFARYVILFTTSDRFPAAEVLEWYRLRWQVELVFKRFKSLAKLGHLPKYDDESAEAWLYGKLLVALLVEKIVRHALTFPPWGYSVPQGPQSQSMA